MQSADFSTLLSLPSSVQIVFSARLSHTPAVHEEAGCSTEISLYGKNPALGLPPFTGTSIFVASYFVNLL